MNTLPKEFVDIRAFLKEIPNINRGGCAIAALAMYRVGVKLGMNIQIVYFYDYDDDQAYKQNGVVAELETGKVTYCTHAGVVIDNHYMDTGGGLLNHRYPYYHILSEPLVIRTLKEAGWNPDFYRPKWLPIIEEVIGEKLLN